MSGKQGKPQRPKAAQPRGFRDYLGAQVTHRRAMLDRIIAVYEAYGFDPLETSAVETVEALGKFLPDVDRPNAGVFAWQDEEAAWLALRYDLTAPLARVYAQYRNDLPSPYRRYAVGPVWRNEKPGPGRFRQFYQCDADTVGSSSMAADAEMGALLMDVLEAVGIARGDYRVSLNNRKILNGVMEVAGILNPDDLDMFANERGIVLRAIDKIDRLGRNGVSALLGEGREDPSGDFTPGAKLSALQNQVIMSFVDAWNIVGNRLSAVGTDDAHAARDHVSAVFRDEPAMRTTESGDLWNGMMLSHLQEIVGESVLGFEGVCELREISDLLSALGYGSDRFTINPSVVRGLGYYTGPVVEAELTFEVRDAKGRVQQFGSVAGGGRYDDLVKRFTGQQVPATGISIGVDRLLAALAARGAGQSALTGPVVVTVMDRARMADYQAMVSELRNAGIRAEVYLGNPKNFGNQLKYADARSSPVAVIEGSDEQARGVVQIKDLALGARLAANITTNDEWKAQPAQIEIARADLVAQVRAMIARAG